MGRIWIKKTERVRNSEERIKNAVQEVLQGSSIRAAAIAHMISYSALQRYVKKAKTLPEAEVFSHKPNTTVRQIFTSEQELHLVNYLVKCSKMHYGLTSAQARELGYKYAVALNLKLSEKHKAEQKLGREWLWGFLKRNNAISLRSPEATSLSRSTSFNKFNVGKFFDNVKDVYDRNSFTAYDIWNCDETGLTTVHSPSKVLAQKGSKQVGQITSGERGQLVTMCGFINAAGNTAPPMFIFPRQRNLDVLGKGAPDNSLILGSHSGWMTSENFVVGFRKFVKHIKCSQTNPVVLFLDNHESHVSLEVIDEARASGVFLVTFPPHCSHRLQPLDVAVYAPFRARFNQACEEWMACNPGKPITLYNIAALANKAYDKAFSKENIQSGFRKTGIWELNREIFTEDDFLMSAVTDRPQPETPDAPAIPSEIAPSLGEPYHTPEPSTSKVISILRLVR